MTAIAVIDHGAGNLVSIGQALHAVGADVIMAETAADIGDVAGIVLPGVGACGPAYQGLVEGGFVAPLTEATVPLLGICVGMQLLFEGSDEDGSPGLGLLAGRVEPLRGAPRLPHIGWNDLIRKRPERLLLAIPEEAPFYFVHSFAPVPADESVVVATTDYEGEFVSMVRAGSRVGVQFHPERSGSPGLAFLAAFLRSCAVAALLEEEPDAP